MASNTGPGSNPSEQVFTLTRPLAVDFFVMRMAEELDIPTRRLRGPLLRLLESIHKKKLSWPLVMQDIATAIEAGRTALDAESPHRSVGSSARASD